MRAVKTTNPLTFTKKKVVNKSVEFIKAIVNQWTYDCQTKNEDRLYQWGEVVFRIENDSNESVSAIESFIRYTELHPDMKRTHREKLWTASVQEKDFDGIDSLTLKGMRNSKEKFSQTFIFN